MAAPFVSASELTDKLGTSAATTRGTAVITAACDMVRTFTEQTLTAGTSTASLDGTGTDALLLPERPVQTVGTVLEGTATLGTADYALGDDGILYRKPGVIDSGWGTEQLRTYWWPGRQNIEVTYVHGYSTVPADLKEVALSMAARLFRQSDGVVSETLGQYSYRLSDNAGDFQGTERIILRKYKQSK